MNSVISRVLSFLLSVKLFSFNKKKEERKNYTCRVQCMGKQKGVDAALELANHLSAYRSYLLLSPTRSCWAGHEALESVDEILWPHGVSSRSIKLNSSSHYEHESSLFCELCPGTPAEKAPMGAFSFLSRNSSRKVSTMIAVFLRPLDKSTMLHRATHWIDSARTFWRHLVLYMCSLERHGTRALVTVGRGHVTRGTQSIAYWLYTFFLFLLEVTCALAPGPWRSTRL